MLTGKKLGGVLCEARWQGPALAWIAVGVGINVTNPVPAELQQTASSLESVAPGVTPDALIEPITRALRMMALDVNRLSSEELIELQGRDWLQGRELLEPVAGIARGVQSDGSLLVERPDGAMVTVRAGHLILG
jgi:biotin-(acetyl-CoA carboxylase) ligase